MLILHIDETDNFKLVKAFKGKRKMNLSEDPRWTLQRSVAVECRVYTGGTPNHNCVRDPVTGQLKCI